MNDPPFPYRPRLNENAMLRRHIADGEEKFVLHDRTREEVLELRPEQIAQLRACDGTRDLGGVMLAAAREDGYRRGSEIEALLRELHARGLLSDGLAIPREHPRYPERPLEVLGDFALRCDRNGACCTTYSSIAFTRAEAQRALRSVEGGPDYDSSRMFLPLCGTGSERLLAVSMREGACAFLGEDRLCLLHVKGGASAKPRGCQVFPATHVDDGEAVRVSVAVECPCVLQSLEPGGPGTSLVPVDARTEGDLAKGTPILRLAEQIAISDGSAAHRRDLSRWSRALAVPLQGIEDGVAAFWSLADAVAKYGLDTEPALGALRSPSIPEPAALAGWLSRLASTCHDRCVSAASWRGERDRVRRLAVWLRAAAQDLARPDVLSARLAEGGPTSHERFYARAVVHGHGLVEERPLVSALRDRAVRLLLARQAGALRIDDPAWRYPITGVEVMMRGQGLDAYAR